MLQAYSNCMRKKHVYMLGDLYEDLLKVNRLKQIFYKRNIFQLRREPARVTRKSKTLIYVIIPNNRNTIMHAETSLFLFTMLLAVQ